VIRKQKERNTHSFRKLKKPTALLRDDWQRPLEEGLMWINGRISFVAGSVMGWVSRLPIRWKAPATVAILVLVVGAAISSAGYLGLRRALHDHVAGRLMTLQAQYRATYRTGNANSRAHIAEAARRPALAAYLREPDATREAAALPAMMPPGPAPEWIVRLELRDASGRVVLSAPGHESQGETKFTTLDTVDGPSLVGLASSGTSDIGYGKLAPDGNVVLFPIVARIGDPTSGFLVVWRRVATTWQAAEQVAAVLGNESAVYMVNADGTLWSQFGRPVASSPEPPVFEGVTVYDRAGVGRVLSVSGPMEGTPWAFVFEFPEAAVQAPAQIFLRTIAWIAPVCILLGMFVAWRISRRLTEPLHELTKAADAIAAGNVSYRAPVTCSDELGRLITSFNSMAAEVEESRTRLESLVNELELVMSRTPLLLIRCSRDLRYVFVNHAAAEFLGRTVEEIISRPISEIMGQTALVTVMPHIERVLRGEIVEFEAEVPYKHPGRRFIRATYTPDRDATGDVIGWVATIIDMTERKQLEAERDERAAELAVALGKRTEEVRRAEKAEQLLREADRRKDEFLATLAHELRGPLAPLRNMLEVLKRADGDGYQRQQARDTMERQLGQFARLIDDLIDISRITRGKIELRKSHVELASVIQQSVEISRPIAECAKHQMTLTLPKEPIYLDADPMRLVQIFSNILNNACKYTEPGGRIWLNAERQGSDVVVKIKDNGMGIPADKLGSVFEMFMQIDQSLERSQGGLGIGLTLVKRLVELHEGSVEAFSGGVGKGSEFVVRLPILVGKPEIEKAKPAAELVEIIGRRVLVVDDNVDAAVSLARLLNMAGNETATAHDGLQAVEAFEKFCPDVILLDIGLPKLNGYDACRRIRETERGASTVIIALTGWGQDDDRAKSKEAGFDAHLVKPVDYGELMKLLRELRPALALFAGQLA
jgi:PAS domain S-box-containing protein